MQKSFITQAAGYPEEGLHHRIFGTMSNRVVYIGLGSNLGDRQANLRGAIAEINHSLGKVVRYSSVYESEPWGFETENWFLNQVLEVETSLSTRKLLEELLLIEERLGRSANNSPSEGQYTDRTIDIDLLVDGEIWYDTETLRVPHPRIAERRFVLEPLNELTPNLVPPGTSGKSIVQLLEQCADHSACRKIA